MNRVFQTLVVVLIMVPFMALPHSVMAEPNGDLSTAVSFLRVDDVRSALDAGADPNIFAGDMRMLQAACRSLSGGGSDRRTVVELLLQAGADPNGRGRNGNTALHLSKGRIGCVAPLLATGADPNLRSEHETSTCRYANLTVLQRIIGLISIDGDPTAMIKGVKALISGGADLEMRACKGDSIHSVLANEFLQASERYKSRNEPPDPDWWRRYVEMWTVFDREKMADSAAQKTMTKALAMARNIERKAQP